MSHTRKDAGNIQRGFRLRAGLIAVVCGALGVVAGILIGWLTVPAGRATPATLRPDLQADYLQMSIQSLQANRDINLALQRWNNLGPAAESLLAQVQQEPGRLNPVLVDAYEQLIRAGLAAAPNHPGEPPLVVLGVNALLALASIAAVAFILISLLPKPRPKPASALVTQPGRVAAPARSAPRTRPAAPAILLPARLPALRPPSGMWKLARYVVSRTLMILLTIFVGVFITVVLANRGGQLDKAVQAEVDMTLDGIHPGWRFYMGMYSTPAGSELEKEKTRLEQAAGLTLPYWPRQLAFTLKALRLDWQTPVQVTSAPGSNYPSHRVIDIILTDLPHTLLLVGTSFFLLFVTGIPLSLYLFRTQGSRLDRAVTLLSPLSSIPSWVLGVLLVMIVAKQLHLLPIGGMYDTISSDSSWQRALGVARHMVLPVLAILLSLLFQCVYTWRSFFLLYADEDYVELARAKGLRNSVVERRYVLRPTLPYILTHFTLLSITFWQMTIALEKIMNWPGIGRLYIITLPNFFGDRFYPGVMPITLGIVVLFAYILGLTVLLLELSYAVVDPQIRLGRQDSTLNEAGPVARRVRPAWRWPWQRDPDADLEPQPAAIFTGQERSVSRPQWHLDLRAAWSSVARGLESLKPLARELQRSPTAIIGLVLVSVIVLGSIYAMTAYPYNKLADIWYMKVLAGKITVPRLAQPEWVNYFRKDKLPTTIILDSRDASVERTTRQDASGISQITITYTVDFPYASPPQDMVLYWRPKYTSKLPFVQLTWITPDGRKIDAGRSSVSSNAPYYISARLNTRRLLMDDPAWRGWFVTSGNDATPPVDLLFAPPGSLGPSALPGTYRLRLEGMTFEPGSDIDAELVLLGQVYSIAGTDNMRRDLIVPLLWGMPFALIFGLLGAFATTILSMTLAAMAAWYGGWLDDLIQRLVEANMVLPIIAIAVLIYSYFNVSIWWLLSLVVLLNVFASPTKSFRAAFLQVRNAPYIEAARSYGASDGRIILKYLVPRILPMFVPQLVTLIPSYVFLEATLGIFNVKSDYPTWGRTIYEALRYGANYGSSYWVLEPLALLLITGLAFAMLGFALERVLNPRTAGKAG